MKDLTRLFLQSALETLVICLLGCLFMLSWNFSVRRRRKWQEELEDTLSTEQEPQEEWKRDIAKKKYSEITFQQALILAGIVGVIGKIIGLFSLFISWYVFSRMGLVEDANNG